MVGRNGRHWSDEIFQVTSQLEYQTCSIKIDWVGDSEEVYDYDTAQTYATTPELSALAKQFADNDWEDGDEYLEAVAELNRLLDEPGTIEHVTISGLDHPGVEGEVAVIQVEGLWVFVAWNEPDRIWGSVDVTSPLYSGPARYIPIRTGTWQGGSAQLNATTVRVVRFQLAEAGSTLRVPSGSIITIEESPRNPTLVGRTAKVTDDFQGGTMGTRTLTAAMDADTEDTEE